MHAQHENLHPLPQTTSETSSAAILLLSRRRELISKQDTQPRRTRSRWVGFYQVHWQESR